VAELFRMKFEANQGYPGEGEKIQNKHNMDDFEIATNFIHAEDKIATMSKA
jgi:hypothetical protein